MLVITEDKDGSDIGEDGLDIAEDGSKRDLSGSILAVIAIIAAVTVSAVSITRLRQESTHWLLFPNKAVVFPLLFSRVTLPSWIVI